MKDLNKDNRRFTELKICKIASFVFINDKKLVLKVIMVILKVICSTKCMIGNQKAPKITRLVLRAHMKTLCKIQHLILKDP